MSKKLFQITTLAAFAFIGLTGTNYLSAITVGEVYTNCWKRGAGGCEEFKKVSLDAFNACKRGWCTDGCKAAGWEIRNYGGDDFCIDPKSPK